MPSLPVAFSACLFRHLFLEKTTAIRQVLYYLQNVKIWNEILTTDLGSTHAIFRESSPNLYPRPFRIALGSLGHPPFDLRSTPVLLLKWENDGRTMGELRNKERWKSGRAYIGHRDGK